MVFALSHCLRNSLSWKNGWFQPLYYLYFVLIDPRGACYFDTDQNNCPSGDALPTSTRNTNLQAWATEITAAGLPWLYWQVIPNADPHVRLHPSYYEEI